ncbi:MAG: hypothetical protein KDC66_15815 [Phaeodactylibacter sp.]|nr:hypothetical protein [Phaeodactylibacter sp.]MCB9273942.1 hypothetical protein [Lewinellaceae bacterium]
MNRTIFVISFLFCLFAGGPAVWGQQPTGRSGQPSGTGGANPREQGEVEVDTFDIFYFYAGNPNQDIPFSDSTLGDYFRQYDPVRHRRLDYKNLGNLGSAHEPIVFETASRRGFDVGLNQFSLYLTPGSELPYYRIEKPFTLVSYTMGSQQADGYTTAKFSRNFANGLNYTLDFKRISQLGETSQYPNQNTRNTALATGLWYHGKRGRYDGFFSFAANTAEQEDNGGILREPQDEGDFSSPSSAEVFLADARTRHSHRELSYTHYYRFGGGQDTLGRVHRSYTVSHRLLYENSIYKYYDKYAVAADSGFYNLFPAFLPDQRGTRFYLDHRRIENSFQLATFKLGPANQNRARNQRDLLEVGAVHTLNLLEEAGADSTINNLFLTGRLRVNPSERLLLNLYGHFGLWDNAGDYRLSGELFFDFKKVGQLRLNAINQLYSPSLMQHRLYLTEQEVYRNNFDKTLATTLAATYSLPHWKLNITGQYHLLNNYIYFDTLGLSRQTGIPISIAQLIVEKDFALMWNLHLDNLVALQQSSEDFIRLPSIYSKHSFYYAGKWFQVLNVRLGVDLRFNDSYFGNYYNPVTGQFQLQDRKEVEFYPAADAFFSMRVTKFRAFFKWENATATFITDRLFYQTAYYGFPSSVFRIGISWRFLN